MTQRDQIDRMVTAVNRMRHTNSWISVTDRLPSIEKINGFWDSVPVIAATEDGRVVGAFFTYSGGDDLGDTIDDVIATPVFTTDEGLPYNVTHWQPMPGHPKDLK